MQTRQLLGIAAALAALSIPGAWAQTTASGTFTAAPVATPFDPTSIAAYGETAQVGVNGPGSSDTYMDVEGRGTGSNSSGVPFKTFGVVDFTNTNYAFAGMPITSVDPTITLKFGDSPFGPTAPGTLNFYLSTNNAPLSGLRYDSTDITTGGIGTQLGTLISLGTGAYTSTASGGPGSYTFTLMLTPTAQNYLVQQFNNPADAMNSTDPGPSTIRFVVADVNNDKEVASLTGAGNAGNEPQFGVTVSPAPTPEPSPFVALTLGAAGLGSLIIARRRKTA